MNTSDNGSDRTSNILASFIVKTRSEGDISINETLELLGERAFGLAILVFSLPNSLPLPSIPGFSAITGAPIILLALQMMLGMQTLRLPRRIGEYRFSREKFCIFLSKALPYIHKVERMLHPRLGFMQSPLAERLTGLAFVILGFILALPIPFGNFLPAISISLIALGLLERDGVMMIAGMIAGCAAGMIIFTAVESLVSAALSTIFGF